VRRFLALVACIACVTGATSGHTVKAVSSDGEATVYLIGNFSRGFNVAYNAVLAQVRTNRATTFVGIMLLGRRRPGGSIAIGLSRNAATAQSLEAFVSSTTAQDATHYQSFPVVCLPACGFILRGDRYGIYAFAVTSDGIRKIGAWARADFEFVRPYVQLNGEVTALGDRIAATLIPMRVVADSRDLPAPRCAFTTRGIEPRRNGGAMLEFTGTYRPGAAASFIDLGTGKRVDRCPR
jgi:hypothetical protein